MKYKEDDYIRTKDGIIDKVIIDYNGHCNNPNCNCKHVSCKYNYYDEDTIIKSSPNIIDLIEVGDYVNGKKVAVNCKENGGNIVLFTDMDCANENNIKSILTKEQFESMEYKVGE